MLSLMRVGVQVCVMVWRFAVSQSIGSAKAAAVTEAMESLDDLLEAQPVDASNEDQGQEEVLESLMSGESMEKREHVESFSRHLMVMADREECKVAEEEECERERYFEEEEEADEEWIDPRDLELGESGIMMMLACLDHLVQSVFAPNMHSDALPWRRGALHWSRRLRRLPRWQMLVPLRSHQFLFHLERRQISPPCQLN
jgi:hypothetical protein